MATALQEAEFDLICLNYITEFDRDRVVVETSKALTLAALHAGIEARIVCRNPVEVKEALTIIYSTRTRQHEGAKWNSTEGGLEYPNGSLVVVMLNGQRQVPR